MMANLNAQMVLLDRARKNYEKAFKEAERALDNFQRADADFNLSRAEVEKQRMNMTIKSQQCEETKNEYANQLQKANDLQVIILKILVRYGPSPRRCVGPHMHVTLYILFHKPHIKNFKVHTVM
jgi:hypothetical protein